MDYHFREKFHKFLWEELNKWVLWEFHKFCGKNSTNRFSESSTNLWEKLHKRIVWEFHKFCGKNLTRSQANAHFLKALTSTRQLWCVTTSSPPAPPRRQTRIFEKAFIRQLWCVTISSPLRSRAPAELLFLSFRPSRENIFLSSFKRSQLSRGGALRGPDLLRAFLVAPGAVFRFSCLYTQTLQFVTESMWFL